MFERAAQEGFKNYELYFVTNEDFSIQMFKKEIDKYSVNDTIGISFRGLYNGQMGYAYTEVIDEEAIELLIRNAKENAIVIEKEDNEEIYEGGENYPEINGYNEEISKLKAADKIQLARKLEKAIYNADERVKSTQYCSIASSE